MSVSVVLPYMFQSLSLTILRGCSCCNATLRLVVFVTTLSGHVAVLSICVVVMFTSLLPVLLCTVHNKTGSREVNMTTIQIESTATCPDKVVTKTTRRKVALQQEQPLRMIKDETCRVEQRTQTF